MGKVGVRDLDSSFKEEEERTAQMSSSMVTKYRSIEVMEMFSTLDRWGRPSRSVAALGLDTQSALASPLSRRSPHCKRLIESAYYRF
jgi:hypothetical protein